MRKTFFILSVVIYEMLGSVIAQAKTVECIPVAEVHAPEALAGLYVECAYKQGLYEGHILDSTNIEEIRVMWSNITTHVSVQFTFENPKGVIQDYFSSRLDEVGWLKKKLKEKGYTLSEHTVLDLASFTVKEPLTLYKDDFATTPEPLPH